MKLKRLHLYLIATLCFVLCFTYLNTKYDRFYRVNGINNDNRALIERYLDEEEQDYLIEHAIAVDEFIDYIEYDEFHLEYYQYYNLLRQAQDYSDLRMLLNDANAMADRLTVEFGNSATERFETLISYNLEYAYLNSTYFDFDNIRYYQLLRTLYSDDNYDYVVNTNTYISIMQTNNISEIYDTFEVMVKTYDSEGVNILMTTEVPEGTEKLYEFDPLLQTVNSTTFISNYQPSNMVEIEGIPRLNYSMYLSTDASTALTEMYQAMGKSMRKRIIITQTYTSYEILNLNNAQGGYSEFQLGNTIEVKEQEVPVGQFGTSDIYSWLVENSYLYGYVLRYPQDKMAVTGTYSTTTFRYVGKDVAKIMHDQNLCLEEYNTLY